MRIAGFEYAESARFQSGVKVGPEIVGPHLELLREKNRGELTPFDVLEDAENPNSPLHEFFEWDEGEAARQYRLDQARGLIRAVVAVYVGEDKPAVRHRAYVHINEKGTPHYREASHAMSQVKTRDMVLQRAWRELTAWRKKYKDLKEFSELVATIDEAQKKIAN